MFVCGRDASTSERPRGLEGSMSRRGSGANWGAHVLACMSALIVTSGCGSSDGAQSDHSWILSEQDVHDVMVGSCIESTRGCSPSRALERLNAAMERGAEFRILPAAAVPDEWRTVSPATVGGGESWEHVLEWAEREGVSETGNPGLQAVRLLSAHLEVDFDAVVRVESAGATATALLLAAEMDVPVVDACLSGRARPEIPQQIPWTMGIPSTPAALSTRWGDEVIIQRGIDDFRAEHLARSVAVASGGSAAIAMNPMTGQEVREGTLHGAVSRSLTLGRTVREAREAGEDPIAALVSVMDGYELFRGTVTRSEQRREFGFFWTDAQLTGIGEYAGETYEIFSKNENIVGWRNGSLDAMAPDYILNLNPRTGEAITGGGLGGYPMGEDVVLIGVPAPSKWATPEAISLIGPRHFGFNFEYVPLRELRAAKNH